MSTGFKPILTEVDFPNWQSPLLRTMKEVWEIQKSESMQNIEIERKFLVTGPSWMSEVFEAHSILQWYIHSDPHKEVRVRVEEQGSAIYMKTRITERSRGEHRIPITHLQAMELLDNSTLIYGHPVTKVRHQVKHQGMVWQIDQFTGINSGLIIAEIELDHENQEFGKPEWLGEEVTKDSKYLNANLAIQPFSRWALFPVEHEGVTQAQQEDGQK